MTLITRENFAFGFSPEACLQCPGNCCIGASGYIWVNDLERQEIAEYLGLEITAFDARYLRQVGKRLSLREHHRHNSCDCIFFAPEQHRCAIYQVRPQQCRSYPFWECYKIGGRKPPEDCPAIVNL